MAVRKRKAPRLRKRIVGIRRKRGKGWSDALAGMWAPVKAAYFLAKGDIGGVEKAFTDLGPRLSQGFTGKGRY